MGMGPPVGRPQPRKRRLLTAATAAALRLTVASRNVRHFAPTGVPAFDPFKARA